MMGKRVLTWLIFKAFPLSVSLSFIFLSGQALFAQSSVKIWEEPLVVPTYLVEAPEPNPIFYNGRAYQGAKGPVYPYPFWDRLTDIRKDITYQAVYLENQYIKICVLPEIGGRIFSGLDKTNNYDFIYRQHVIKPALIGLLGAWISGGVEWNIPHHHRATTFIPVDHTIVRNPDGSATIWTGELELRHRTRWLVGLTIKPESAAIDVTIKIFNRTPLAHSMLCFANVAIHANKDYQVIFPPDTEFATFHGKNQFSHWPISTETYNRQDYTRGVDVSWWKNHSSPTSFFAWENEGDFLAGYDHGKEAGVAFIGDHNFVPGKKLWTWGTGPEGKLWEKILTETDGPYAELMIGAYSDNQPDYSWIQPSEVRTVQQTWFPIRKIAGMKAANNNAACNLAMTEKGTAAVGFCTPSEYRDAKVILKAGEKTIFEEIIAIGPGQPYFKEVSSPLGIKEESLALALLTSDGKELISYKPQKKLATPMPSPVTPPPAPKDIPTIEELYLTGLRLEQFYNPAFEPYPYYEEALKRDPDDYRVNTALGLLYLKRAMYPEAEAKLQRAVKRATKNYTRPKDGEALYYLGVALRSQSKLKEAEDAFFRATWSAAWEGAAFYQLAELACGRSEFSRALELVDSSLAANANNTKALNLKSALLRKLKKFGEAKKIASEILASDPLDFWAGHEIYLALRGDGRKEEADNAAEAQYARMRVETPINYLELAVGYGNCGLWEEAIEVLTRLTESRGKSAALFPLLHYFLGYYWDQKGDAEKARSCLLRAAAMPPDYCFPFQSECLDVFRWAQRINPKDARAPYYLGNYLFDLQPEKAMGEWEKSVALDNSFSISLRNLGLAYARVKNDVPRAIAFLEKAMACNEDDPRLYFELDQLYEVGQSDPQMRLALLEKNHKVVSLRDDALTREILLLVQLGRYDKAIELLKSHHFHVWEGGGEIYSVFVDAHLLRGQDLMAAKKYGQALEDFETAVTYPENLEVAAPASGGGSAKIYFWIGMACEALGEKTKAGASFEKAAAFRHGWSELGYYQALAFQKLGKETEANRIFDGLIQFAHERLKAAPSMDFFEKFGERQSATAQNAQMHYLLGLGCLGKGQKQEARAEFEKALSIHPNHLGARRQLAALKK
jgi:tetratricopeptide (TPR) repeat protein